MPARDIPAPRQDPAAAFALGEHPAPAAVVTPAKAPAELPWRALCDQAPGPVSLLDLTGRFVYVNEAMCRLLGYAERELIGRPCQDVTYPGDATLNAETIEQVLAGPRRGPVRTRYLRADGSPMWTLCSMSVIRDEAGRPSYLLTQCQDNTVRGEAELRWHRSFANAPIGMVLMDLSRRWTAVNGALCGLLGYSGDELLAAAPADLTYPDDPCDDEAALADLIAGRAVTVSLTRRYRHSEGHPLWLLIRISVVPGADGRAGCLIGQYEAIGDGGMVDEHLAHLALHDPLTGLANRALLTERLAEELAESRHGGALAVLLADLDGLKLVNDRYGHAMGDRLLVAAAAALLDAVRPGDTVARLGGDEFVVLSRVADQAAAAALRERVAARLCTEVATAGTSLRLRASVGLAVTARAGTTAAGLLHAADQDMYARKRAGRAHVVPAPVETPACAAG